MKDHLDPDRCTTCNNWPQWCKCLTQSQRLEHARLLAQEIDRWTKEASVQGGLKIKAEQAQMRALDLKWRAQERLFELLNEDADTGK
jgi:hypothetical protein